MQERISDKDYSHRIFMFMSNSIYNHNFNNFMSQNFRYVSMKDIVTGQVTEIKTKGDKKE